jgi:putative membrane protein
VSLAYFTSFLAMIGPGSVLAIASLPFLGPIALLWLAGAALAILVRWLEWRRTRFALADGTLFVETGWWRHRRSIIPCRKVQSVDLAENFWSRTFRICALRLGVAGGSGFSDHHVPALSRAEAEALRAELLS